MQHCYLIVELIIIQFLRRITLVCVMKLHVHDGNLMEYGHTFMFLPLFQREITSMPSVGFPGQCSLSTVGFSLRKEFVSR